jgi:hypothetical protein
MSSSGTRLTNRFRYLVDMIIVPAAGWWFRATAARAGRGGGVKARAPDDGRPPYDLVAKSVKLPGWPPPIPSRTVTVCMPVVGVGQSKSSVNVGRHTT